MKPTYGWHFYRGVLRGGGVAPANGVWLRVDGPITICAWGLHGSRRATQALAYAPVRDGDETPLTACRVEFGRVYASTPDKLVSDARRIVARASINPLLEDFLRHVVLAACDKSPELMLTDMVLDWLLNPRTKVSRYDVYTWTTEAEALMRHHNYLRRYPSDLGAPRALQQLRDMTFTYHGGRTLASRALLAARTFGLVKELDTRIEDLFKEHMQ